MSIPFNKPFITGNELTYMSEVMRTGKFSGEGVFSKKCTSFFENKYNIKKAFLTNSCTDALEMAAILLNIEPGDEIIIPAYTFVSTANAFVLRGAKIVFVDSDKDHPNVNVHAIEKLITPKTKAIVVVHYAGIACDMDEVMQIAHKHKLFVIEDAAQAIDSYYKDRPLGSIGHMAAFSFHETKNIISGEGGLLAINDDRFLQRAEIISEKGTNRSSFIKGEVNKYEWVDIGSSFMPSELTAAFLYAQFEKLEVIQLKRKTLWNNYFELLKTLEEQGNIKRPHIPSYAAHNAHIYYILLNSLEERTAMIRFLKEKGISSAFHFLSLNKSRFYKDQNDKDLINSDMYTDRLLRLPLYHELSVEEVDYICRQIELFFKMER